MKGDVFAQKYWTTNCISFKQKKLLFSVPESYSRNKKNLKSKSTIQIDTDSIESSFSGEFNSSLLVKNWDVGSKTKKFDYASLTMQILLCFKSGQNHVYKNFKDLLENTILDNDVKKFAKSQHKLIKSQKPIFISKIINHSEWYYHKNEFDTCYLSFPLNEKNYILISLDLSANHDSKYYPNALSIIDKIIDSFVITNLL